MGRIHPLPPGEAEKLAAGEVVEHPTSVVKELIENSLDAGARTISVEAVQAGRSLIRVRDDGEGILAEDLPRAVLPHHTSKIRSLADLYRGFGQMGFRGEALAAIAAVSRLTLISRPPGQEVGRFVTVHAGKVVEQGEVPIQPGTEVEVADLFYSVPVRRKFLRSPRTERHHLVRTLSTYALAFPRVSFSLTLDGGEVLRTRGEGELREVIALLYDPELAAALIPVEKEHRGYRLWGLAAPPTIHRRNRASQLIFVNRRPVRIPLLGKAVDEGYFQYLSAEKKAVVFLFLEVPPEELDVNVHPQKLEVDFAEPQLVLTLIREALRGALATHAVEKRRELSEKIYGAPPPPLRPTKELTQAELRSTQGEEERGIPVIEEGRPIVPPERPAGRREELSVVEPAAPASPPEREAAAQLPSQWKRLAEQGRIAARLATEERRILGQVELTYIALVSGGELFLVDQHSAHERIQFARLWEVYRAGGAERIKRQRLLFPLEVNLSAPAAELARQAPALLASLGVVARPAGDRLLVEELPPFLAERISAQDLTSLLEAFADPEAPREEERLVKELAARLACRSAIKAGEALSPAQMEALVAELIALPDASSCPHGRPTIVTLPGRELEKLFLRDRG